MNSGVPNPVDYNPALPGLGNQSTSAAGEPVRPAQLEFHKHRARLDVPQPLGPTKSLFEHITQEVRQLLEMIPEGAVFTDSEGWIKHVNRQAAALLGCAHAAKLLEKAIFGLIGPSKRARLRAEVATVLRTGVLHRGNYNLLTAPARRCPVELTVAVWPGGPKLPGGLLFLMRDLFEQRQTEERIRKLQIALNRTLVAIADDVTERKRTEESLKERDQLSHTIIETALHGFWMVDLRGRLLDVNEAYCRMCGYSRNELLRMHISDLEVNEPSRQAVVRHIKRIIRKGSDRFETQHRCKGGRILQLEVSATYLDLGRPYLFAFLNDITERKKMEEDRQHFSQQLMETQEAERSRMGRELHDGVNQIIASAKMRLRKVDEHAAALGPATREILARCDQLLLQALNENRRIAHNLHPSDLRELGLAEACRILCQDAAARTSMVVKPIVPRRWRRLTPASELNLFRIAQESLSNVEQHARAKSVQLELSCKGDSIVMKITDDGRGFDTGKFKSSRSGIRGAGLSNMRERATALGGTCTVFSAPRRGTTITIRVPRNAK